MQIDLAALNKHHVPGTAYHWKHGYIPLDARTAALWGKKSHAEALIRQGRIGTPEPEHWHALFGKHKGEESPTASKTNTAIRELPIVARAVERKQTIDAGHEARRVAAKNYVEAYRVHIAEASKRFPHGSDSKKTAAELNVTRTMHAAIQAGVPGLNKPDVSEPHTQGTQIGEFTRTYGMEDWRKMGQWKAAHEANIAAIREHFNGPARTGSRRGYTSKDLVALRAHLNKKEGAGPKAPPKPRAEKINPRSLTERVFHPQNGDVIQHENSGPNERLIYRESKQGWQRQVRLGEGMSWGSKPEVVHPKMIQTVAQGDLARLGNPGVVGLDPAAAHAYSKSPERLARVNAETLAKGQAAFGTGTVGGFKAVSAQDALRGTTFAASLHEHGSYYLKHEQHGTVIHVNDGVPVSQEHLHRLATNVETATNMTAPMLGTHPVNYHIDSMYGVSEAKAGRGVATPWSRANAAAYVGGGDKDHVHLNPATVTGPYEPTGARDHHGMHYSHQAPNSQVGTIVHELGHIHHNRNGNYSNDQNGDGRKFTAKQLEQVARQYGAETIRPEITQFHHDAYQPIREHRMGVGRRRAMYGETNNREGYAEAFSQHVFNQTNPGPQTPINMTQQTADELHGLHSVIAESYAKRFNWPKWAGAGKGVKTA